MFNNRAVRIVHYYIVCIAAWLDLNLLSVSESAAGLKKVPIIISL